MGFNSTELWHDHREEIALPCRAKPPSCVNRSGVLAPDAVEALAVLRISESFACTG